jgi:hypothetical protein
LYDPRIAAVTTILDIVHHPVFCLKRDILETGFCLRLQVEPAELGPVDRASLRLWTPATEPIGLLQIVADGRTP